MHIMNVEKIKYHHDIKYKSFNLLHTMSSALLKFRGRIDVSFSARARFMLKNIHSIHTTIASRFILILHFEASTSEWGNEMK